MDFSEQDLKGAVCNFFDCTKVYKSHNMFAGNYILQPVTLLWNVVSVLYVCIYFGLSDWSLPIYPIVFQYPGLPVGGKHNAHESQ